MERIAYLEGGFRDDDLFTHWFSEVLDRLPQEDFDKIQETNHLYFYLVEQSQVLSQPVKSPVALNDELLLCLFPGNIIHFDPLIIKGMIAHELAHIVLRHPTLKIPKVQGGDLIKWRLEKETEADQLAVEWGFGEGIQKFREYDNTYADLASLFASRPGLR